MIFKRRCYEINHPAQISNKSSFFGSIFGTPRHKSDVLEKSRKKEKIYVGDMCVRCGTFFENQNLSNNQREIEKPQ